VPPLRRECDIAATKPRALLDIDGARGEGGGQLLRTALALSAVTGQAVRVYDIRARRDKPGLAPQHLAAARALAALCGATVEGLALRSREISFSPGPLRGAQYRCDIGTAGSVTLVLQALLPVMIAAADSFAVSVTGGTDVRAAPPVDYLGEVLLAHLGRMGAEIEMTIVRRGYYPVGGGEVHIRVRPCRLRPCHVDAAGELRKVAGLAHVARLRPDIATRMRDAVLSRLPAVAASALAVEERVLADDAAVGAGGAIVAWATCAHSVLGAGRVAERAKRAEDLGAAVGDELRADLESGAGFDVHAADQLLVYLALAGAGSFTTRTLSSHARTAMWLIEQFLPVRFATDSRDGLVYVRVERR
jgi:RNA 3'-terminal phosphate cyclase (ATP)